MTDQNKLDNVGFVVCPKRLAPCNIDKVRSAAARHGIDTKLVRDINPRDAFARATRALLKEGTIQEGNRGVLRDKITDADAERISYQYSARVVHEQAVYDAQCLISFDKKSQAIFVKPLGELAPGAQAQVRQQVLALWEKAGYTYTNQHLGSLVDRIFSKVTRKIPLRRGVFFIGVQYESLVNKVRDFLEDLGIGFYVWTIGLGEKEARTDVLKAVVDDVKRNISDLTAQVERLRKEGKLTKRMAKARFKEKYQEIQHYRQIARTLHTELSTVLKNAGDAGKTLNLLGQGPDAIIAAVNAGHTLDQLAVVLTDVREEREGKLIEAVSRINAPEVPQNIAKDKTLVEVPSGFAAPQV